MIVGIDMGGTHIDGAIIKAGKIIKTIKNPVDKNDMLNTILLTLKQLLKDYDKNEIKRINLSTTISTNAIVEKQISKVGLIVQSGPGRNYDFLKINEYTEFISGNIDHRGAIVSHLDYKEIKKIKSKFLQAEIDTIGIISKFSTRNPSFEKELKTFLENDFNSITLGHSMSGKLNFPRRVKTAYLNAAVQKTFNDFIVDLEKSLAIERISAPVYILKADGGTMTISKAKDMPVETILSGPAASFMGLSAMFLEKDDGILLDIGGTSTDIFFLANGQPLFEPLGISIDEHKTLIRAIYCVSIGVGGDSFVSLKNQKISVGPQRKDKPIAFGGQFLTPTDAMVALNKLDAKFKEKSIIALSEMGEKVNMTYIEVANAILDEMIESIYSKVEKLLDKINSHPVYTIKELLKNHKITPKFINLSGGPAKILAPYIENKFKLKTKYPKDYMVQNAIGAALAKPTLEINLHADTDRKTLIVPEADIYETIDKSYNLIKAKDRSISIINEQALQFNTDVKNIEAEIVEANSYNMVKGYQNSKNIRVRAQIKPGLIYNLWEANNGKS